MNDLPKGFRVTESKTAPFPVDTEGAPLITECPATDCGSIDLDVFRGAGGKTWVLVCGNGHMAIMSPKETQE